MVAARLSALRAGHWHPLLPGAKAPSRGKSDSARLKSCPDTNLANADFAMRGTSQVRLVMIPRKGPYKDGQNRELLAASF